MEELFHEQHAVVTYQSFNAIAKLQKILRLYIFAILGLLGSLEGPLRSLKPSHSFKSYSSY